MRHALKEWNCTIEALGKGQIIALWRKGGLADSPSVTAPFESFNIQENRFVLFPTFKHQEPEKVKNDVWLLQDRSTAPNKDNQIKLKFFAEVEETISIESKEELLCIFNELPHSEEYLNSSWNLYPKHHGKLLLLRVHLLPNPILITNLPKYEGCKSWIELNIDVPKTGSKPVLSFKDFRQKVRLIHALLEDFKYTATKEGNKAIPIVCS